MTSGDEIASNPFADPSTGGSQRESAEESTLIVGRNASLTLGTDSLIVLGTRHIGKRFLLKVKS